MMNRKRVSMIDWLQTIYLDISISESSVIYVQDEITKKIKTIELGKLNGFEGVLSKLDELIHPRYTKVIVDFGASCGIIIDYIDNKYNKFVEKDDIFIKEDMIFEMVEIRKATRKDIEYLKNKMSNKKLKKIMDKVMRNE